MDTLSPTPEASPQPQPSPLEHEIAELERQLAEKREAAKRSPGEQAPLSIQQPQPAAAAPQPTMASVTSTAPVAKQTLRSQQVQTLTQIALDEGIKQAVEIARKTNNAYLLDELHDALQDELYKALKGKS